MSRRDNKIKEKLENILLNKTVTGKEIEKVMVLFKEYEASNLRIINFLNRERKYEANKVNGAIKQFLNSHPILTRELIGSLTKRILGSVLTNKTKKISLIERIIKWIKK